jgi:hypothetical protein
MKRLDALCEPWNRRCGHALNAVTAPPPCSTRAEPADWTGTAFKAETTAECASAAEP